MTVFLYARVSKDEARLTCRSGCIDNKGNPFSWVPDERSEATTCPICRNATDVNPKNTIILQRDTMQPWAMSKFPGHRIGSFWEVVTSTIPWRERPVAGEIVRQATRGDHIVVYRPDRGWRDVRHFLNDTEELRKRGVTFHVLQPELTLDGTAQSQAFATFLMIGAQMERDMTSMRTKDGLRSRRERGLAYSGSPPLGFRHVHSTDGRQLLVPDDDEVAKMLAVIEAKKRLSWSEMLPWANSIGLLNRDGNPFRLGGLRNFYFTAMALKQKGKLSQPRPV